MTLVLLALALATRAAVAGVVPPADETFLTLRYAQHLAAGNGLVYNPGAPWEPVLGIASPGQAVLLAAATGLGLSVARAAVALNVLADLTSVVLVLALLARRPALARLGALALVLVPGLVWSSVAGLAGAPLVALVLGACLAAERGSFGSAGVLTGLALSLRPEAALVVPGLLLVAGRRESRWLALTLSLALCAALYLGTLRAVYGSPVPAPVVASLVDGAPYREALGAILGGVFAPHPVHLPVSLLGLWGTLRLVRERSPVAPLVVGAGLALALWLCLAPRLSEAAYVLPRAALGLGAARALAPLAERGARALRPAALAGLATGLALLAVAGLRLGAPRDGRVLLERVWAPLAAWSAESGLVRGDGTLLASEAGAVGWFAGGVVLDRAGLTWPGRRYGSFLERILAAAPEYLLLRARREELAALRSIDDLSRAYYPIRRFSLTGETELEPDLAELADGEAATDYLLFRRRQ